MSVLRIFSYLPNPRVAKSLIAARILGVDVDVVGAAPPELAGWLWDFDARPLADGEADDGAPTARRAQRGFGGVLHKTDAFLAAHPFGTVPAAFSPDGRTGIFESNSILRAVARAGGGLYGDDAYSASRVDAFLDADLVFAREAQVYLLAFPHVDAAARERMHAAFAFFLSGIDEALANGAYVAGDALSIADIAFVCDTAQFLAERRMAARVDDASVEPIATDAELAAFPRAIGHLLRLSEEPAFAPDIGAAVEKLDLAARA